MSLSVVALLLAAAFLHAAWNAILRGSDDRLWSISLFCAIGGLVAFPFALFLPAPGRESWGYVAISSMLQVGYCLFLVRAYRDAHLALVYPIARGTAPLLVTLGAAIFAGEIVTGAGAWGIGLISLGIMTLALGAERPDVRSTLAALTAGLFIASYMVVDGLGVRTASSASGYAAWQAVVAGLLMPIVFTAIRGGPPALPRGREGVLVVVAAIFGVFGYCAAVWAMSLAPMGQVSALRETSILFAALIGAVMLREPMTWRKIVGGIAVTAGIGLLALD